MSLSDGLVAAWNFDESSGNASDSVGWFTLVNTNTCTYGTWMIGNGVDTHSTGNKYLTVASNLWLNGSSQNWTVSLWIYPNGNISSQAVFANWVDYTYRVYNYIEWYSSACRLVRVRGWIAADVCSKSQSFNNATWYHICGRYNGSTLNLKINNGTATTLSSTGNGSWSGYWNETAIWAYTSWGGTNFKWRTDIWLVWNRSITDDEVTEVYNSGAGKQYPFTTPPKNGFFTLFANQ